MEISPILSLLEKRHGITVRSAYYAKIAEWVGWWRGYYKPFHEYDELGADQRKHTRRIYSMKMAKKICEDWATILLNEKTTLTFEDAASGKFVQGDDGTGGVFGATDFWERGNRLVARAFATGTGAVLMRVKGMRVASDGVSAADPSARISLECVPATCIVPLSTDGDRITECAFVSETEHRGIPHIYLETHTLEDGKYVIANEYFRYDGALQPLPLPDGMAGRIQTGSSIPWFAIIRPNIDNQYRDAGGMGVSVYGDAIDQLKGVDLAYNNFNKDIVLGGKKVFYNKSMIVQDANGKLLTPDDVGQQLFMQIGEGMDFDAKDAVQEYNPSLRVQENTDAVQEQLNYLSFKCGFGTKHYQFRGDKVMTAREYTGNKQELVQQAHRHYIVIERALKQVCQMILFAGQKYCGAPVDPDTLVTVNFEDGFIIDKDAERERDRMDVAAGLMMAWEYRVKWCGETEEQAKAVLAGASIRFDE